MQSVHLFVGACAAALLGAVTGATIGTDPLERGVDAWQQIPRHESSAAPFDRETTPPALPDHYPLITPEGRFEVGELRNRGLYRNRRFAIASWWDDAFEPAYELAEPDYRYISPEFPAPAPPAAREPSPDPVEAGAPVVLAAAESEALAPPPIEPPTALAGGARQIDVAAELAERR